MDAMGQAFLGQSCAPALFPTTILPLPAEVDLFERRKLTLLSICCQLIGHGYLGRRGKELFGAEREGTVLVAGAAAGLERRA